MNFQREKKIFFFQEILGVLEIVGTTPTQATTKSPTQLELRKINPTQ